MFRLLVFLLVFTASSVYAGQVIILYPITVNDRNNESITILPAGSCGQSLTECYANKEASGYTCGGYYASWCAITSFGNSGSTLLLRKGSSTISYANAFTQVDDGLECSTNDECFEVANRKCDNQGLMLSDFQFIEPGNYTFGCADAPPSPEEGCENQVVEQCSSHLGMSDFIYTDDGMGNHSCSGTCNDGSEAAPQEECTLYNNYCDVADAPSDLDFGAGGAGSSVDPSNTTAEDSVNDIDYEPDGTAADPTAPFSSIQGDKLINEVIKNRNDNTANLAATTDTTNQTIVEKSDDISDTISNSANGIIDAINDQAPFYDGNIVEGMKQFSVKIENLADIFGNLKEDFGELKDDLATDLGTDYVHTTQHASFANFDVLFSADSGTQLEELVEGLQLVIKTESLNFQASLKELVSIGSPSVGEYEQKSLELSGWGTFDISLSRFTALFGGLGNIIYFLAAMTAMTIVLGGIRL